MAKPREYENEEPVDDQDILLWLMHKAYRQTKFIYREDAETYELWVDHHSDGIYGIDGRDHYVLSPQLVERLRTKGWVAGQACYYTRMFADHRLVLTRRGQHMSEIIAS